MNSLSICKNDLVIVLSGKDKGKKGKVLNTFPKNGKVTVEGVNMCTKHRKPRRQTDPGGIMHQETPIYACKVMHICPKCARPTRAAHLILEDGSKVRICKQCKETI